MRVIEHQEGDRERERYIYIEPEKKSIQSLEEIDRDKWTEN